jgi:Ca2+-binding EF-hand superfamily protein
MESSRRERKEIIAVIMKLPLLIRRTLPLVLFAALVLTVTASAQEPAAKEQAAGDKDTVVVVAEGVGLTAEAAQKQAFRNAVQQGVGALVDSTTIIKNDKLIEDEVLTYSHGFIKSWDEISNRKVDGLHVVKIRAVVKRRDLSVQLKKLNIASTLLDAKMSIKVDGKNLFGTAFTKIEARQKATLILAKVFEDWPKLLHATLDEEPVYDEMKRELRLKIKLGYQQEEYDKFRQRLLSVVSEIALAKKSFLVTSTPLIPLVGPAGIVMGFPKGPVFDQGNMGDEKGTWSLWVMTGKATTARIRWEVFQLDADPLPLWRLQESAHFVKITIRDSKGVALKEISLPCDRWREHMTFPFFAVKSYGKIFHLRIQWPGVKHSVDSRKLGVFVAPLLELGDRGFMRPYIHPEEVIPLSVDLLRQIDSIDVSVEFRLGISVHEKREEELFRIEALTVAREVYLTAGPGRPGQRPLAVRNALHEHYNELNLKQVASFFNKLDKNEDGALDKEEYTAAIGHIKAELYRLSQTSRIDQVPKGLPNVVGCDKNGDGKVTPEELNSGFQAVDRAYIAAQTMTRCDTNRDGTLDKGEWCMYLWIKDSFDEDGDAKITLKELTKGFRDVPSYPFARGIGRLSDWK